MCLLAGGCATGSDAIREEVISVRRSGKPVVVSMGNMATSGGYLISVAFRKSNTKPNRCAYVTPLSLLYCVNIKQSATMAL